MSTHFVETDSEGQLSDSSDLNGEMNMFRRINNPTAISEAVEEVREAPVKKFGSFRVVNKWVKKVSLRTPLEPDHTYNAVAFNVTVKKNADKWVFVTGFEASGVLQKMSIFKLVGKDVNQYIHQENHWEIIHEKWYPKSWDTATFLRLDEPVRIGPGETCGFYIHSNCESDMGLMYRSCAPGVVLEDSCIQVLHGWAHTSCIPFDLNRGWIRQHRVLSGKIFYEPTPLRWSPDRNFFWRRKTSFQNALDAVMSSCYFSLGVLVELMTFCDMDWFDPEYDLPLEESDDGSSSSSVEMLTNSRQQGRLAYESRILSNPFANLMDRVTGLLGVWSQTVPSAREPLAGGEHNAPDEMNFEEKSPPPLDEEEDQSDGDDSVVLVNTVLS